MATVSTGPRLWDPATATRLALLGVLFSLRAAAEPVPVEIVTTDAGYQLLRGGQPYYVQGAGVESGSLQQLALAGGNSLRTWTTEGAGELLDRAHERGLTVSLCLNIGRERLGFDYDDPQAVREQYQRLRREVLRYKDHPALLAWIIGNEPNLNYSNPRLFDAINELSKMIHEVDGLHPTTTALAGFDAELARHINERSPDLDFLSIQYYGAIDTLPGTLRDTGFSRPIMVTEWGTTGHWEVPNTSWGAPLEMHSSDKADAYLRRYREVIEPYPAQVLGSYVFFWGQKQERTPTWYGMFLPDGSATETVDVMHYIWRGQWPEPRAPRVATMSLAGAAAGDDIQLRSGESYPAGIELRDADGAQLRFTWEIMEESQATEVGGDYEDEPPRLEGLIAGGSGATVQVTAPAEPGPYRLFVYVHGPGGRAAHANIPFLVTASAAPR